MEEQKNGSLTNVISPLDNYHVALPPPITNFWIPVAVLRERNLQTNHQQHLRDEIPVEKKTEADINIVKKTGQVGFCRNFRPNISFFCKR